ncbi:MAG: LCP family protein [Candidatus Kerfeldbacteria bacterium]|nr:LCP family protein [Candidatus Kerfeldbacteria bacterium]
MSKQPEPAVELAAIAEVKPAFDHRLWVIPVILVIIAALLAYNALPSIGQGNQTIFNQLGSLVTQYDTPVKGEAKDRINVLLLGIGGAGHDGGTLTDSIMIASIKPSTKQVALLSLPRDLVVKIYDETDPDYWEGRKINYAYVLGGMDLAVEKVSEVTGLTLHYYVLVDFSGFRSLIDDVGGITVTVPTSFTGLYGAQELSTPCPKRNLYYLDDGPYCAIQFDQGTEQMDGERALIYSRIRKLAPGSVHQDQGSDFARAKRQQQVLQGFKDKVLSAGTVLNPTKISSLTTDLDDHMIMNLELWEMARIFQLIGVVDPDSIINQVVDDSTDGLVHSTIATETGASVVVPNAGDYDYSAIQKLAKTIFTLEPTKVESQKTLNTEENTEEAATDQVIVQILNGTNTVGLASTLAANLELQGYEISNVGNALTRDYSITTIYQVNTELDPTIATAMQNQVPGALASSRQTETLLSLDSEGSVLDSGADFIIIVGSDATNTTNTPTTTQASQE